MGGEADEVQQGVDVVLGGGGTQEAAHVPAEDGGGSAGAVGGARRTNGPGRGVGEGADVEGWQLGGHGFGQGGDGGGVHAAGGQRDPDVAAAAGAGGADDVLDPDGGE